MSDPEVRCQVATNEVTLNRYRRCRNRAQSHLAADGRRLCAIHSTFSLRGKWYRTFTEREWENLKADEL